METKTEPKQMESKEGKRSKQKEASVEDYYQNKNFVKPKEKTLETIFEEPKFSKTGVELYTSVKKYKRFLHFSEYPTSEKLRKRRNKAKKYSKIFKRSTRVKITSKPKLGEQISEEQEMALVADDNFTNVKQLLSDAVDASSENQNINSELLQSSTSNFSIFNNVGLKCLEETLNQSPSPNSNDPVLEKKMLSKDEETLIISSNNGHVINDNIELDMYKKQLPDFSHDSDSTEHSVVDNFSITDKFNFDKPTTNDIS